MASIEVTPEGKIIIDPSDIFEQMDDENKLKMAQRFAWDSVIWQQLKDAVLNEYGRVSYNEDILKLRMAFLTEAPEYGDLHTPFDRVSDVVAAIIEEMKRENEKARTAEANYWRLYHWAIEHVSQYDRQQIPRKDDLPTYKHYSKEAAELLGLWMSNTVESEE